MRSISFNPRAVARDLKAAGIEADHAEAIAEAMRAAATADRTDLATRADVAAVKGDVAAVKADVAARRWMFGFLAALNLAMAAKLFGLV